MVELEVLDKLALVPPKRVRCHEFQNTRRLDEMQEIDLTIKTVICLFVHFHSFLSSQVPRFVLYAAATAQIEVVSAEFLPVSVIERSSIQDDFFKLLLIVVFVFNNACNPQLFLVLGV